MYVSENSFIAKMYSYHLILPSLLIKQLIVYGEANDKTLAIVSSFTHIELTVRHVEVVLLEHHILVSGGQQGWCLRNSYNMLSHCPYTSLFMINNFINWLNEVSGSSDSLAGAYVTTQAKDFY